MRSPSTCRTSRRTTPRTRTSITAAAGSCGGWSSTCAGSRPSTRTSSSRRGAPASGVGGRSARRRSPTRAARRWHLRGARARSGCYVNLDTGTPLTLAPSFFEVYGEAVRAHKVSARLQHPGADGRREPAAVAAADRGLRHLRSRQQRDLLVRGRGRARGLARRAPDRPRARSSSGPASIPGDEPELHRGPGRPATRSRCGSWSVTRCAASGAGPPYAGLLGSRPCRSS